MVKVIKRALMVVIIVMLISSSLLFLSSFASASKTTNSNLPTPGSVIYGSDFTGTKAVKNGDVHFEDNDAYPVWATEPYIYMTSIWNGEYNERVNVYVKIGGTDFSGVGDQASFYIKDKNGHSVRIVSSDDVKNNLRATLIQKAEWRSGSNLETDSNFGYIKPSSSEVYYDNNGYIVAHFSFLTNTSSYTNGIFEVHIQIKLEWRGFWPWTFNHAWEDYATIYGEFSWGDIKNNPPTQDVTDLGYTKISGTVYTGIYDIQLWYAGDNGTWNVTQEGVINPENTSKLMKDFGEFSASQNSQYSLKYTFNSTDPSGIYLWIFYSKYKDGKILKYFSVVIHNNAKDLATEGNPPGVSVSFSGERKINEDLTIIINVSGSNGKDVYVWIIAYYGAQLNTIPAVTDSVIMPLYNYPIEFTSDGSKQIKVRMNMGGQFNVIVTAKRIGEHVMNIAMNYTAIQGFEGAPSGIPNQPNWFEWPWQSTTNMVILFIGVLLIFSRRPTLSVIGILLFFAAFVNWTYVGAMIKAGLNPLNWFHLGVLR